LQIFNLAPNQAYWCFGHLPELGLVRNAGRSECCSGVE
jgi:hypothetical protein